MTAETIALAPYVGGALGASGVAVAAAGRRELRARWCSWLGTAAVIGVVSWLGSLGWLALSVTLGAVAALEYARLRGLAGPERLILIAAAMTLPTIAYGSPEHLLTALLVLPWLFVFPSVMVADPTAAPRQARDALFGLMLLTGLLGFVLLPPLVVVTAALAVSLGDIAAWAGGRLLGRRWPRQLSSLSPNKTVIGMVTGVLVSLAVVLFVGAVTSTALPLGLLVAVALGAPFGDLVESQLKREAGVKDAGQWLPGFGGLLDRVDSLLPVLTLALVLS